MQSIKDYKGKCFTIIDEEFAIQVMTNSLVIIFNYYLFSFVLNVISLSTSAARCASAQKYNHVIGLG